MITIKTSYQKSLSKPPKKLIPILAYENAGNRGKAMGKMKKKPSNNTKHRTFSLRSESC